MFEGFDPDRRPPYSQEVFRVIGGNLYKITWWVSNGYGGSIRASSSSMELIEENYEESLDRKPT